MFDGECVEQQQGVQMAVMVGNNNILVQRG